MIDITLDLLGTRVVYVDVHRDAVSIRRGVVVAIRHKGLIGCTPDDKPGVEDKVSPDRIFLVSDLMSQAGHLLLGRAVAAALPSAGDDADIPF